MPKVNETILRNKLVQGTASNLKKLLAGVEKTPADRISKADKALAAKVNTEAQKIEAVKDLIAERGTGTFADIPINLARMLPSVKKVLPDDKYRELLYSYQSKIVNADRKAGEALASKSKTLKKILTTTDLEPGAHVTTEGNNIVQAFVPKETQRLSAPLDKAKNFAVPILTLYGVDKVINGNKDEKVAHDSRDLLINKVATHLSTLLPRPVLPQSALEKIARASELLVKANDSITNLKADNEKLAQDVDVLRKQLFAKERAQKAVKLANEMVGKGLIKQAAVASQVDYIMGLDEEGFKVLNKTVRDVPVKKAMSTPESVEKLSCLITDPYIDSLEKPSFRDAILHFGNEL